MIKLKPCPFCGNGGAIDYAHGGNQHYTDASGKDMNTPFLYEVVCCVCGAKTDKTDDPNMAIKLWNRRVNDG